MRRARSLRLVQVLLAGAVIGVMLLLSACGGNSQLQQQASQAHSQLDQQIQHAKSIGVPLSSLQPIIQQEQTLNNNGAPFSPFSDTPDNTFYKNQTSSYQQLAEPASARGRHCDWSGPGAGPARSSEL